MPRNNIYFWGHAHSNWGDNLSPHIYRWLTGKHPRLDIRGDNRLVMVGSLAHVLHEGDNIWGTGMLSAHHVPKAKQLVFHAVRGPLTRQALMRVGYRNIPETYGDPGVLMPLIYPVDTIDVQYDVGVILHYADADKANRSNMVRENCTLIDICAGVRDVMAHAARCRTILSSSLHGVILGESLGKNTAHIMLSDNLAGGTFKFDDWYLSSGRRSGLSLDCRERFDLERAIDHAAMVPRMNIDVHRLLECFPADWR